MRLLKHKGKENLQQVNRFFDQTKRYFSNTTCIYICIILRQKNIQLIDNRKMVNED